jgi:hypothetical protein
MQKRFAAAGLLIGILLIPALDTASAGLERQILQEAQALLAGNPTDEQLAAFEKQAAARVLARLKEIK